MTAAVVEIAEEDPARLAEVFAGSPLHRPVEAFALLLAQHRAWERVVLVGWLDGKAVAHGSLVWEPTYPPFRQAGIPEIQDVNVAPPYRRRGVASAILDRAEQLAASRAAVVGIGFGLHPGYRAAQRLYVRRGYVPDGQGVFCRGRFLEENETIVLDDGPVLYLTKDLA
jgi:GNAT superfamily N-acetyltransferase